MTTVSPPLAPPRSRGRLSLWSGLLLAVGGFFAYGAQMAAGLLTTPWYVPALATLGAALALLALVQSFSVWRVAALLFTAALAAFASWFVFSHTRLPAYTGPVAVGQRFPDFAASRADGTPFTRADLEGAKDTVLVFYRGWW